MSTYYISTGELTRMYTLRVRYMDTASIEDEAQTKIQRITKLKKVS